MKTVKVSAVAPSKLVRMGAKHNIKIVTNNYASHTLKKQLKIDLNMELHKNQNHLSIFSILLMQE